MSRNLKMKEKQDKPDNDRREKAAGLIALIGFAFFVLTFILLGISELIDENFIASRMLGAYSAVCICTFFSLIFISLATGIRKNWLGKLFLSFIAAFGAVGIYHFTETSILLYKDKNAYETKQFETVVQIPIGEEYDDPDYGPEFLMELEFNGLTVDVHSLEISKSYYQENLSGKQLQVDYLPNSRYAVSVKEYTAK